MLEVIFREYDIRGLYGKELNEKSVKAIGYFLGLSMLERGCKNVSVGYDARYSANELFTYLLSGLNFTGLRVYDLGLVPTPLGYFSLYEGAKFDANIMITGSHNPKDYNGFKITILKESFFGAELKALGREIIEFLQQGEKDQGTKLNEKLTKNDEAYKKSKASKDAKNLAKCVEDIPINTKCEKYDILSLYLEFMAKQFSHLQGFDYEFGIDCANGASGIVIEPLLKALNLKAEILFAKPNGQFPNHAPDPTERENLKALQELLEKNSSLKMGFAFDGDADRMVALSKKHIFAGDELCYLFAKNIPNPRVLGEVKCSQNLFDEVGKFGEIFMGKTGHSHIKKAMKAQNIDLAAEVSGHIFFKHRYFGYDDGIYAFLRTLELIHKGFDLEALINSLPRLYTSEELKIPVSEDEKFKLVEKFKEAVKKGRLDEELKNILRQNPHSLAEFKDAKNSQDLAEFKEEDSSISKERQEEKNSKPSKEKNGGTSTNSSKLDLDQITVKDLCEIDGLRIDFGFGWALLRASNTSPYLVTRFEAKSLELANALQEAVFKVFNRIRT